MESNDQTIFNEQQFKIDLLELENLKLKQKSLQKDYENNQEESWKVGIHLEIFRIVDDTLTVLRKPGSKEFILKELSKKWNDLEKLKFTIQNLLEAIKRGENPAEALSKYKTLGLVETSCIPKAAKDSSKKNEINNANAGIWIWNIIRGPLRKLASKLVSLIYNFLKCIPKFIGIKPVIGITGIFPTLSFVFESESLSLSELWELLNGEIIDDDKENG